MKIPGRSKVWRQCVQSGPQEGIQRITRVSSGSPDLCAAPIFFKHLRTQVLCGIICVTWSKGTGQTHESSKRDHTHETRSTTCSHGKLRTCHALGVLRSLSNRPCKSTPIDVSQSRQEFGRSLPACIERKLLSCVKVEP